MAEAEAASFDPASQARRLATDAAQLVGDLGETREWLAREARARVDQNPWAWIAGAAFVGYVLGGGLSAPLTRRMLRFGLRFAVIPVLRGGLGPTEAAIPPSPMPH